MKKRVFHIILGLFLPLFWLSAENVMLTDEDAGQLLYYSKRDVVLVFRKGFRKPTGRSQLECIPFRGDGSIYHVSPRDCTNLNYTESELTPEIAAMELAYWTCQRGYRARNLSDGYRRLAERMNEPVTNLMLSFYKNLDKYRSSVRREIDQYRAAKRKSSEQPKKQQVFNRSCPYSSRNSSKGSSSNTLGLVLEKGLKASLKNSNATRVILNLAEKQKNFFLAFCLYVRYREVALAEIRNSGISSELQQELRDEINQTGEDVREKYVQNRADNQNREKSFKAVFPDKHGKWEHAPPTDLQEMYTEFVLSCYTAWRKTQTLSPHSEFPEWGNAMLEVLQMIRNPDWKNRYDAAFSEYQKYNNN